MSSVEVDKWYYINDGTKRNVAVKVIEIIENRAGEKLAWRVHDGMKSFLVYREAQFIEEIKP